MKKLLFWILISLTINGCGLVGDFDDMFEKQRRAETLIQEKYGWESHLGFNITNGILTQVTFMLKADEVKDRTVEELEVIMNDIAAEVFTRKPKRIFIHISSIPK